MFNLFKKKKPTKPAPPAKTVDTTQDEPDDAITYIYSASVLPEQYQHRRVSIEQWEKADGDIVKKGEHLCKLELENVYGVSIKIEALADGVLEIFKYSSNSVLYPAFLTENEKVCTIYKDADKQKILELKNKRFRNIPIVKPDYFSGTKEIKWESVAGRKKSDSYDTGIYDSFIFFTDDNNWDKLIFTFNNLDNKDFIIFKYPTKDYKLTVGSKISFLFESGEILEFEITNKPHKHSEHSDWGHIFETRVQLIAEELEILKTKTFSRWQIEFAKTGKKITGVIESPDTQFSVNKLAKEYYDLVQREITDYQPLTGKQKNPSDTNPESEECYVYLMIDLTNNYHKIGISNKPEYREKTLQSEKPTIEMLCNKRFPNRKIANSFEQALHQSYADKRIRGEWFNLTDKEVQELKETLTS
ncbi:MAG: hypothetical protein DRJ02_09465 [Bacteroidetes bacterium]|nr:MAG: hypothetical protein DRI87_05850 [Bacteroidota bacterium]RLD85945.1 MAG: hypothetical protein DRJ02_09465 [Bacteroidota bacterium]